MNRKDADGDDPEYSRREILELGGGVLGTATGVAGLAGRLRESPEDRSDDGIPDSLKRSESFNEFLDETFRTRDFDGLDPERTELLVDLRYVGGTGISERAKTQVVELFRANGIHLHWLDYPDRYDRERFESEYGYRAEDLLWPTGSFYQKEVESPVKNVAVQLIVIPPSDQDGGTYLHASFQTLSSGGESSIAGLSLGNRAVVTEQARVRDEVGLVLHEVAHLGICHDDDPANTGVMGPDPEEVDLMPDEWRTLRSRLDNVRDRTGFDLALRPCIWEEYYDQVIVDGG